MRQEEGSGDRIIELLSDLSVRADRLESESDLAELVGILGELRRAVDEEVDALRDVLTSGKSWQEDVKKRAAQVTQDTDSPAAILILRAKEGLDAMVGKYQTLTHYQDEFSNVAEALEIHKPILRYHERTASQGDVVAIIQSTCTDMANRLRISLIGEG